MVYCALIYPKKKKDSESIFKYFEEILWHFVDKVTPSRQQHGEKLKRQGLLDFENRVRNILLTYCMTLLSSETDEKKVIRLVDFDVFYTVS